LIKLSEVEELKAASRGAIVDRELVRLVDRKGIDGCRLYLEDLRWPGGAECPRCESGRLLWIGKRAKYHCRDCRYQFRVTAGTLFHDTHLPLPKWFLAISLMLSSDRGLPATRLHEILGGSYKTAWFLEHRIRAAMGGQVGELGPLVAFVAAETAVPSGSDELRRTAGGGVEVPASWFLLKRIVAGQYHRLSPKYLTAYWDEIRWRDAHHRNPHAFRDTVIALLGHPPVSYEQLVAPPAPAAVMVSAA